MKDTNKPHIYDALILDRALDEKIKEKDLVSNSEVFDIVQEVVSKLKWPEEPATAVCNNLLHREPKKHTRNGFVKISRHSGNYEFRNPFQLSKGGF